eukprot:2564928-Amphidinium_carterae.1
MYRGNRRILAQGAVSDGVQATCGLPPACGHAVDVLHAFLIRSPRQVLASLTSVNMCANALKTVVLCNAKVWRVRLPQVQITTRDLGVDTQWLTISMICVAQPCPRKAHQLLQRVHKLDPCVKAASARTEVGGIPPEQHMKDLRAAAHGALGKGAPALRRCRASELMAHGGPIQFGDPRVAVDLSTVRVRQHQLNAGRVTWALSETIW